MRAPFWAGPKVPFAQSQAVDEWQQRAAWVWFALTYLVLALGYLPWFRLDRTGAAFVGAVAMIACGVLTPEQAFQAQDHATLVLLFSMMIIVSFLMNSGMIGRLQGVILSRVKTPRALLWTVLGLSAGLSALFINDVVCLMLTPVVLTCCRQLGWAPVPHLLALAMASNLGSLATPVGNPQNIFLASLGKVSYQEFVTTLAPVAILGLFLLGACLEWLYAGKWMLETPAEKTPLEEPPPLAGYVFFRTLGVLGALLLAFWLGYPLGVAASAGAAFLMVTRRISRAKLFALIDWDLLVLFVSLFVLTEAAERAGILQTCYAFLKQAPLALSTLVLSNIFSNVPAVFFLAPLAREHNQFLLMAMISTLAGNLTLLGSIANLIVAEKAAPEVRLSFWSYTRVGLPVTIVTMLAGAIYWKIRFGD